MKVDGWRKALGAKIFNGLSKVSFGPNGLELETLIQELQPSINQILSDKGSYIERWQIIMAIADRIYRDFSIFEGRPTSILSFGEHFSEKRVKSVSQNLAEFFSSLPRSYVLVAQIPHLSGLDCTNFVLTKRISAVDCIEREPSMRLSDLGRTDSVLLRALKRREVESGKKMSESAEAGFYLRTSISGFGSTSFDNAAVREGIDRFKQAIFLLYIEGIIEIGSQYDSSTVVLPKMYIQDLANEESKLEEVHIPESLKAFLCRLKIDLKRKSKIDTDRDRFKKSEGQPYTLLGTPLEPDPYLFLSPKCCQIVDCDGENPNAVAFKNALIWGFDSLMNEHDSVMSFIQLSIALEAILGADAERSNKTRQLADRCAFIIGNNRHKRQELREAFIEFYKIRSELVHGSKTKLDSSVVKWKNWGEWALQSILKRELLFGNFEPPTYTLFPV